MTLVNIDIDIKVSDYGINTKHVIESYILNMQDYFEKNSIACLVDSYSITSS